MPRCSHVLARYPEALELLRFAAGIDIDDTAGSTAQGLHVATMGGVWLALVEGFAGVQADGDGLCCSSDGSLPMGDADGTPGISWNRVQLQIKGEEVKVETGGPLRVTVVRD